MKKYSVPILIFYISLFASSLFGQSSMTYESLSQCILQTMTERELTGNNMFNLVKNDCERIIGKDESEFGETTKNECERIFGEKECERILNKVNSKDKKVTNEVFYYRKAHGEGEINFPNGEKFIGEWKDGKRDGQGVLTYPDGKKYFGQW